MTDDIPGCFPASVNCGSWLTAYTLDELHGRIREQSLVLPICSLGTPFETLSGLGGLVLPPLYHEALDGALKKALLDRIAQCFPYYEGTRRRAQSNASFEVVELPQNEYEPDRTHRVLAFSVDTAVEQHGPHLPLATDTIQSYAVLKELSRKVPDLGLAPPVEYGHLTWGLPFGLSIDITTPLLTEYVGRFASAIQRWAAPEALYVVDVHGSPVHRQAIQDGLAKSDAERWSFRWLHEPIADLSTNREDPHAGGVETAMIHHINEDLVDAAWWPDRVSDLEAGELKLQQALELSKDMDRFIAYTEANPVNGIVGSIQNYFHVNAATMMRDILEVAAQDVEKLLLH